MTADEFDAGEAATAESGAAATTTAPEAGAGGGAASSSVPMEVDSQAGEPQAAAAAATPEALSDDELALEVYKALMLALMQEVSGGSASKVEEVVGLQTERQLLAFHHAARLFDHREAVVQTLLAGKGAPAIAGFPEVYSKMARGARASLETSGLWLPSREGAFKSKRIFGHRSGTKFIKLPVLPKSAKGCCVYVKEVEEDSAAGVVRFGGGLCFQGCETPHPLQDLEKSGLAVVLTMDDVEPGARIIISPLLASSEEAEGVVKAFCEASTLRQKEQRIGGLSEKLMNFVGMEANAWRAFAEQEQRLFRSEASMKTLQRALKVAAERPWTAGSTAAPKATAAPAAGDVEAATTPTPQKRKASDMDGAGDGGEVEGETPPEKKERGGDVDEASLRAGQEAYGKLLGALFKELGFYADAENGWLDVKKELLIYHHAAALYDHKEAMLNALRGDDDTLAKLPRVHQRVLGGLRGEIKADLVKAGNVKAKRVFGHDHVIKFHSPPKGLPIAKHSCVFLRERPQSTSDNLRKTPSLFRDVVRFRCQGNPLTQLEEHGLALVMTVTQYQPRAFLVMSPLLEHPEKIAENAHKPWPEIEQNLKESLVQYIARDCDAWSAFTQRHGHLMTKESLKILQKVLKSYKPDPRALPAADAEAWRAQGDDGDGAGLRLLFEELAMAREDVRAREVLAHKATQEKESAKAKDSSAVEMAQSEVQHVTERLRQAEEKLAEQEEQNRKLSEEKTQLCEEKEDLEVKNEVLQEKVEGLSKEMDGKAEELPKEVTKQVKGELKKLGKQMDKQRGAMEQELDEARASADAWKDKADAAEEKAKKEVEKSKAAAKEKVAAAKSESEAAMKAAKSESEAAMKEHTRLAGEQVQAAREQLEEAKQAEARARAELEMKARSIEQLQESNVGLRTDLAKAKEVEATAEAAIAQAKEKQAAAETSQAEAVSKLEEKTSEASRLKEELEALRQELQGEKDLRTQADERAAKAAATEVESRKAEAQVKAELKAKTEEAAHVSQSCAEKQAEAQRQVDEAQAMASKAKEEMEASKAASEEAKKAEIQAREELKLKAETVATLQNSNVELRADLAKARDGEGKAVASAAEAEKAAEAAHEKELQARSDLAGKCEELLALKVERDSLASDVTVSQNAAKASEDAAAEAKRCEAEARTAKVKAEAELQPKLEEVERLTKACVALQGEAARAKEEVGLAGERVAEAGKAVEEAKRQEASAKAELQVKAATAETLSLANGELRKELLAARKESAEAAQRTEEAAKQKKAAEAKVEDAKKQEAAAQAAAKKSDNAAAAAEAKAAQTEEMRRKLEALVGSLQEAASQARTTEVKASADLQVKKSEVERLNSVCAQLGAKAKALHAEVIDWKNKTTLADTRAEEARAQFHIALKASELTEEEVKRMAEEGKSGAAKTKKTTSATGSSTAPVPPEDGSKVEAEILADIEQALLSGISTPHKESKASPSQAQSSTKAAAQENSDDVVGPAASPSRKLRRRPSKEEEPPSKRGKAKLGSLALHGPRAKSKALAVAAGRMKRRLNAKTASAEAGVDASSSAPAKKTKK
eukprot:TRINITY_DN9938_c0_g1_i2.p1 TRINITY_DN9938_c0_g1~~TRINITY_DN9938_c0_g1_i2.p1  ORF type:complete len:1698 (-),score=718.52 TRINITY_DN9938_c0_g1_i2:123-4826(-)